MNVDRCPICQAKLARRLQRIVDSVSNESFSVDQCVECGLGLTMPVPTDVSRYYGDDYHGGRHGITAGMCDRRRLRIVKSCAAGDRLLDVGCGDGTFLKAAESNGWSVCGVEPYPEQPRSLGLTVFKNLDDAKAEAPFDCVTLWHSLEHLADIDHSIASVRQMLTSEGCVIVAVPNAASYQATLLGRNWLHWDVPRHLYHFSEESLGKLASKHSLRATRLPYTEVEYDLMGWTQGVLNALFHERNLFFRQLTGKKVEASRLKKMICLVLGVIVSAVAAIPSVIGAMTGRGGTLIMKLGPDERQGNGRHNHV